MSGEELVMIIMASRNTNVVIAAKHVTSACHVCMSRLYVTFVYVTFVPSPHRLNCNRNPMDPSSGHRILSRLGFKGWLLVQGYVLNIVSSTKLSRWEFRLRVI